MIFKAEFILSYLYENVHMVWKCYGGLQVVTNMNGCMRSEKLEIGKLLCWFIFSWDLRKSPNHILERPIHPKNIDYILPSSLPGGTGQPFPLHSDGL